MATQQDSKLGCNEADKSPTCLVCGQDVRRPQVVDVPEGGVQLRDWIQSLVQACDCFGLSVVGPIVDGGEASAVAYSTDVALCQFCRDLLVADCDDFDQEDLIGDWLEPDEESILD